MIAPALSKETAARIEAVSQDRIRAIDSHLLSSIGPHWLEFRRSVTGASGLPESRKESWRFHLSAMPVLRAAVHTSALDVMQATAARPIEIPATAARADIELSLPSSHWSLDDDLTNAWHPEVDEGRVSPCEGSEIVQFTPRLETAIELLEAAPWSTELVRHECAAVCLVESKPPLPPGRCISLTSKSVPGMVYVSAVPPILAAESVVHESAHLRLRGIEVLAPLYANEHALVQTPLRSDPRPVSGLLHQAYVLRHLVPLYECLLALSHPQVKKNLGPTEKRLAQHNQDLRVAIDQLEAAMPHLTPDGQRIAALLAQTSEDQIVL